MIRARSWLVPGHNMWRVRCVRRARKGPIVAIRARHRFLPWQTIVVQTRDLRYGGEAVARYLSGGRAGYSLQDSRSRRQPLQPDQATQSG